MKPKKLPRLWCALQGLLPVDSCLAAQRAELALPCDEREMSADAGSLGMVMTLPEYEFAESQTSRNRGSREPQRT